MTVRLPLLLVAVVLCGQLLGTPGELCAGERRLGTVGLQVVPAATGELLVLQIPEGTPAAQAGMRPGDMIVQIDEYPLAGSAFADVVAQRLWGEEGSPLVLYYLRPGEAGRKTVTLRRGADAPKLTVTPAMHGKPAAQGGKR